MIAIVDQLRRGIELEAGQARDLAEAIMTGTLSDEAVKSVLLALREKGETPTEIGAFADAMLARAIAPGGMEQSRSQPVLDIVGTGGDGSGSFNISTAAAIVVAGAGGRKDRLRVVKHGNRAVSGRCGAADVMEALGVPMPIPDHRIAPCLNGPGFAFLFAPRHHPALASLAPVRRALGVRTIFNLVGPLVNPASPSHAIIGACSRTLAENLASTAVGLRTQSCWGLTSDNGWDEATPICPFTVFACEKSDPRGAVATTLTAADFGLPACRAQDLVGGGARENAQAIVRLLEGERSAFRDAVVLNAALALQLVGVASTPLEGASLAAQAIESGAARRTLADVVAAAQAGGDA